MSTIQLICLGVLFTVLLFLVALPRLTSDRRSCFDNCIHFIKGSCTLYGDGHIAKHPCPDKIKKKDFKYDPEKDDY